MTNNFNKIGVMLIDDNPPRGLWSSYSSNADAPKLTPSRVFSKYFDLKWFSSVTEVREYRDSIRLIGYKSPTLLTEEKLVCELICFDYAMTRQKETVSERYSQSDVTDSLCLLPKLKRIRKQLDIPDPPQTNVPTWGPKNEDDQGCFAGGLLFSLLADYPCAPVALTVKETVSPAVEFFEWMLAIDAYNAFNNRGRTNPTWQELITEGVQTLRMRIEELATAGIIYLNLYDLLKLVEPEYPLPEFDANATEPEEPTLTFHSRYGKKTLPINGLFIDISEEKRPEEAKEWATRILGKLLDINKIHEIKIEDIKKGLELANNLFKSYTNKRLRIQRHTLSEAVKELTEYWLKTPQNEKDWLDNAKEWASCNLETLFGANKEEEIKKGMEFANSAFDSYSKLPLNKQNVLLGETGKGLRELKALLSKEEVSNPHDEGIEKVREQITNIIKNLYDGQKNDVLKNNMESADRLLDAFTRLNSNKKSTLLSEMMKGLDKLRARWIKERHKEQDGNIPDGFKMTIINLGKYNDDENLTINYFTSKSYNEHNQIYLQNGKKILKMYMREYLKKQFPNELKKELKKELKEKSQTEAELNRIVSEKLQEKTDILEMQFNNYWKCPIDNKSEELEADCMRNWLDIRTGKSDIQKRWAVLFMIVKLYRFRSTALQNFHEKFSELHNQDPDDAERLKQFIHPENFDRIITHQDLYEAVYPLPKGEQIVIPPKDPAATWKHASQGNLGVSFIDVLNSKNWEENGSKGFMKGERTILIMYANSFKDWNWEETVPSLRAILKPEVNRS